MQTLIKGVNALNGLSSFLLLLKFLSTQELLCVNALNGLSSFLLEKISILATILMVCQRPKRAFFISTVLKKVRS